MSVTFATVAEGATDHAVLENILLGLCKHHNLESGSVTPVQPLVDETGKQLPSSHGGWQQIFLWLKNKQYRDALQFNDHVIIQIDTDVCDQSEFGVRKDTNATRTISMLIADVRSKLEGLIDPEDIRIYASRFHFAISVHSVECWLLPIWGEPAEAKRILTCKQRVDNGLSRAGKAGLRKDDVRTYDNASAPFRKPTKLQEARNSQESLNQFLTSLDTACSAITPATPPEKIESAEGSGSAQEVGQ